MPPLRARYAKIERMVAGILAENGITEPAVPIQNLVKKANVIIKSGDLGDVSGLLVRGQGRPTIGVNCTHPRVRQRFTIAHEYAHLMLHAGIETHVDTTYRIRNRVEEGSHSTSTDSTYRINYRAEEASQATNVEEIEANFFAACLLMPREFLDRDDAIDALDDDSAVARLASRYLVSRHAMSLRLANLYQIHRPF